MGNPQTIQIFLVEGNASGIKIAEITNRAIQAIVVPRNKIEIISKRAELNNVGLYFLFGKDPGKIKTKIYIGEAEECLIRLKHHNRNKDFWSHSIVIVSQKNAFTKGHVKYLEHLAIKDATEINRFDVSENKTIPGKPYVTESMEADLMDYYETIKLLVSTLGYPVFDKISTDDAELENLLYINRVGVKATGKFIDEGMVIFKGSEARIKEAASCHKFISDLRQRLLDEGILVINNQKYQFTQDYIVPSPSTASNLIIGSSTNGWVKWVDKDGQTLDSIVRK
ncbi:MAG: GIY-YIG nuclease family protein [Bacteroidota bacterium]